MKKQLKWLIPLLMIIVLTASFLLYTGNYYRADGTALSALKSDGAVAVTRTDYGWFFDGPSDKDALIFYPGAKVGETAYAPMLRLLAEQGMDVCLVRMPFHLAVFGANKATDVIPMYRYKHWYIGGHSLGGAMAANYAAGHGGQLTGVILLAAYPTKALDKNLIEISIRGSEDRVLNMDKAKAGKACAPDHYFELVIKGGNHARFGNYGTQKGDGTAAITAAEQQKRAVGFIINKRLLK